MNSIKQSLTSKDIANEEPVFYCKNCLSLRIKTVLVGSNLDYCDECGSTIIETSSIEEWNTLYKNRYGVEYLNKDYNKYGRTED